MTTQFNVSAIGRAAVVSMMAFATVLGVNAATITVDGITYTTKGNAATVAQKADKSFYKGDIVIPETVTDGGTTYNVTAIAPKAFKGTSADAPNDKLTSVVLPKTITTTPRGCFQNCSVLKSVTLPSALTKIQQDAFSGCLALEEISIPAGVTTLTANMFQNCPALAKITFEESTTAIEVGVNIWGSTAAADRGLVELYINRPVTTTGATGPAAMPFPSLPKLAKVVYGENATTDIPSYSYQNCKALTEVVLPAGLTGIGGQAFLNTGLTSIDIPAGVTTISSSTFSGCSALADVKMGGGVTKIDDMAFYNAGVKTITWPSALTSIGAYAFSGASFEGGLNLPAALTTIGSQAFAKNASVTAINLPATVKSIGSAAFMSCPALAKYTVAEDNEAYKVLATGALATKDGALILNYPAANPATTFADADATEIDAYAFYNAKNLTEINFAKANVYGDYAFSGTGIKNIVVNGTIGRYLLKDCKSLEEVTVGGKEVPFGICSGCSALTKYNRLNDITIVRQEAFKDCTSLKSLDLGRILVIIEADAFAGISPMEITVAAHTPAALGVDVFTESTPITVIVPEALVAAYKAADGWRNLTIKGDANLAEGGLDMGMPAGLYYAGVDGNIHCVYADGQNDTYDVGGVPHTFQLIQFKNRIYGASAGQKFVFSNTAGSEGDGKLFYISRVDGNVFQATVLDNAGNNAYKDPFGLYIYGDTLYVNDRNVCIRKIPAGAIALPQSYPSWMENNWMNYYGNPWTYGCIKSGFSITQDVNEKGEPEPLYWVSMKHNGLGLFRFKESHIGTASAAGPATGYDPMFVNAAPMITTFYIDVLNDHLYAYIETANGGEFKGGLYRFNMADLLKTPNPSKLADLNPVLVDGAPVRWEGAGVERVGISQLSADDSGEYLYWCYRAASATDIDNVAKGTDNHPAWAEEYNAENPLHQTGIKRVKLGSENPVPEMVVAGAEGYGVVAVNYEGSVKPSGVENTIVNEKAAYDRVLVAGRSFTVTDAAAVNVYSANGSLVLTDNVAAGATVTVEGAAGVYVIEAVFADGAKQTAKIAVK